MRKRDGKLLMAPELEKLLTDYFAARTSANFTKLVDWLKKPYGSNYEFLYELLKVELNTDGTIDFPLRLKVAKLMVQKANGRYELCSMYGIAMIYGIEDAALDQISHSAESYGSGNYYNSTTWKLFWATHPNTKLADLAEQRLQKLGSPIPQMTAVEKNMFAIELLVGSFAA